MMHGIPPSIHRVSRDFLVVSVWTYGAMGIALLINVVLTRRLGTEGFGHVALLLMVSHILSLFAANWTHVGFVRYGAWEFASGGTVAETLWTRMWIVAPWVTIAAVAMVVGRDHLARYLDIPGWGLSVIFGHFLLSYPLATLGAVFQARNEMPRYGMTLFLERAVTLTIIAVLPLAWIRDPLIVIGGYATSCLLISVCGVAVLGWRSFLPVTLDRASYRKMLRFCFPLIASGWVGLFGTQWLDYVIIRWYLPLAELGLYSLASQLAGVVQQVTIIFSTLLLPQLAVMVANGQEAKIRAFVERLLPYWFLGISVLLTGVLLCSPLLLPLVFGTPFRGSISPLALLLLATSALALFNAFTPLVSAYGLTWPLAGICLLSAFVNVVMDLLLIPVFGINGSAVATVLAYWSSAILVLMLVQKRLGGLVVRLAVLSAPVVIVYLALWLLEGFYSFAAAIVGGGVSVYLLSAKFRLFCGEDATYLRELFPVALVQLEALRALVVRKGSA